MYPQGGPRQPDFDFEQIINRIRTVFSPIARRMGGGGIGLVITAVAALGVAIWLATGIYTIGPGEQVALRLFGEARETPVTETGLHWWWPRWVGSKDKVLASETRRMELGFRGAEGVVDATVPVEALMISGDLNIVDVRMVVQYNIRDLTAFLFRVNDPGEGARNIAAGQPDGRTLKDAAEAALRLVVGQRSIDDVLTEQREQVQAATKERLQELLDDYDTGINILNVQLQDVKAPEEVRDAFDDVLRARQERDTKINQARAFENDILPRARGDAERIIKEAEAFAAARVARAEGEADRFTAVLEEFGRSAASRDVTRQRLYLEAMEEILPRINKIVVSPEAQSVLILGGQEGLTPVPIGPSPNR
jgi:membrane protease subunit HflK